MREYIYFSETEKKAFMAWQLKAGIVEQKESSFVMRHPDKHVSAAMDK
jgi:hypothetical protein